MAMNYTSSGPIGSVSFLVRPSGAQNNFPQGTTVVLWGTEVYDDGGNFASNTFTAPVTGKYYLATTLYIDHIDTASDYNECKIVTSNRTVTINYDLGPLNSDPVYWNFAMSMVMDMDASDTAQIKVTIGANSAAQADLEGTGSAFSGCLIG